MGDVRPAGAGRRVAVLGIGNVLAGDDGVGPAVVRTLVARHEFEPEIVIEDLGTPGLDLVPHLAGADRVVLVDAVRAGATPGSVRVIEQRELLAGGAGPRVGPHDPGLADALATLRFAGRAPRELVLVGIEPADVSTGVGLSETVRAALPEACKAVCARLRRWGIAVRRHPGRLSPDLWWLDRNIEAAGP
ncbi:MAG: HyaD/HybD family hydrogenase maturation endopeptidase [Acidobacteriota bacterium]